MIRRPATVLVLLTALNLLNYLDRLVLSAVLPQVQADLRLSNLAGGALATVFLIGYFATSPIFGTWADRAGQGGRKRLIAVGIAIWSVATVASGLARGAAALFAARAFVGVGEASYATIAPTLIDDIAPPSQKGRWMAIFYAATPVGSALGYVVGGAVEHAYGWRSAFYVAGAPGIAIGLLCLLIAEPPRQGPVTRPHFVKSTRTLLRMPFLRATILGYCAYTFAIGGFAYWAPAYLHARYGLEAGTGAKTFGLVTVGAGAIGTLLGGWLGDVTARRRSPSGLDDATIARSNLIVCALATGVGAPLAAVAIAATTARGFFVAVFPCEVALFAISGPINVALLRSVPAALRASAMALTIFAIHAFGDLWSPPLIGLVADHAPMEVAMYAGPALYAVAAIVWWRAARSPPWLTSTAGVR